MTGHEKEPRPETISGSDLAKRIKEIGGEDGELIFLSMARVFLLGQEISVDTPKEEILKTLTELSKLTFNNTYVTRISTKTVAEYELFQPNSRLELTLITSTKFSPAALYLTGKLIVNNEDTWKLLTNYEFVNGEAVFTGGINSYTSNERENTTQVWMKARFNNKTHEFDPVIIFSVRIGDQKQLSHTICLPFISPSQAKNALTMKNSD